MLEESPEFQNPAAPQFDSIAPLDGLGIVGATLPAVVVGDVQASDQISASREFEVAHRFDLNHGLLGFVWSAGGFLVFLVASLIGLTAAVAFAGVDPASLLDVGAIPIVVIAVAALFQQVAQTIWPLAAARWFPGVKMADLRLGFKPVDLAHGLVVAVAGMLAAALAGLAMAKLVGLENLSEAGNTQILTNSKGSPWLYLLLLVVVFGAPISEELFFRGLVLSSFENFGGGIGKRFGASPAMLRKWAIAVGIAGSTVVFTLPHFNWAGLDESLVLFASIGAFGVVLAGAAIWTNRLAASIFGHMIFNAVAASQALSVAQ